MILCKISFLTFFVEKKIVVVKFYNGLHKKYKEQLVFIN